MIGVVEFFARAGLRLHSQRQSWGAVDDDLVLLKTWTDEWDPQTREVGVMNQRWHEKDRRFGLKERLAHLDLLWSHGKPGYTAIAESKDEDAPTRATKAFRTNEVYPILRMQVDAQGVIRAQLGDALPVEDIRAHAKTHRTERGSGPLPLNDRLRGLLEDYWKQYGPKNSAATNKQLEARFARTQVRPEQAAFRLAVYKAWRGECPLSGCRVPEALEAAHIKGRDWKAGQNAASDGILLRRDLHSLYDNDLIRISASGAVSVGAKAYDDYGSLEPVTVTWPK